MKSSNTEWPVTYEDVERRQLLFAARETSWKQRLEWIEGMLRFVAQAKDAAESAKTPRSLGNGK